MIEQLARRGFLAHSIAGTAAFGAALGSEPLGAVVRRGPVPPSEKIRVGFIGLGGMGTGTLNGFLKHEDVEVPAVCDVYAPNANRAREIVANMRGAAPDVYKDFRHVIDRKDIDAVVVSTPDHWHAIPSIYSCMAEQDVYCEKPLTYAIDEGKAMVKAARQHKRVTQMGTQVHAGENYRRVDAIKSRERCSCDWEYGHRLTTAVLLGNVALKAGKKIHWAADRELCVDASGKPDAEANKFLSREYRAPWKLPA